jgi:hypothetical protein
MVTQGEARYRNPKRSTVLQHNLRHNTVTQGGNTIAKQGEAPYRNRR